MTFYFNIGTGWGDQVDSPSLSEMKKMLFGLDTSDEEHGAAWLAAGDDESDSEDGYVLEWGGGGILSFEDPSGRQGHLKDVTRERALELWCLLAEGRIAEIENQPWEPGNGYVHSEEAEALEREAKVKYQREFYDSLGAERADVGCKKDDCGRGAIEFSVFCRTHHFESLRRGPCPFDD